MWFGVEVSKHKKYELSLLNYIFLFGSLLNRCFRVYQINKQKINTKYERESINYKTNIKNKEKGERILHKTSIKTQFFCFVDFSFSTISVFVSKKKRKREKMKNKNK